MIAAALLTSCLGSRGEGTADTANVPNKPASLESKSWGGVECADLAIPFDYAATTSDAFLLKLSRLRALKPSELIGVLLVNTGAPRRSLAQNAACYFSRDIIDRFEIVAWDPCGTDE